MIGRRIREARVAQKLTLREVGEALNVTPQAVAGWEKSNPNFPLPRASQIADVLKADLAWLIGDTGRDFISALSRSKADDVIPVISFVEAATINSNYKTFNSQKNVIIPSTPPVGRGFCVVAEIEFVSYPFKMGDLLIFDTGIEARQGDYMIALFTDNNKEIVYRLCRFAHEDLEPDELEQMQGLGSEADSRISFAPWGVKPIAVLVEHRRLRKPSGRQPE